MTQEEQKQIDLLTEVHTTQKFILSSVEKQYKEFQDHRAEERAWQEGFNNRLAEHGTRLGHLESDHAKVRWTWKVLRAVGLTLIALAAFKFGDIESLWRELR